MESMRKWTPPLMCVASMTLLVSQIYGYIALRWYVPAGSGSPERQAAWLLSPEKHVVSGLNLVGFFLLILTLALVYFRFADRLGRFGFAAFAAALLGTCLMYGDVWFEAFATPLVAELAPQAVGRFTASIVLGAALTFVGFGLGWALFGLSFFLARCVPRPVSALLIASGLYGWQALTAPKLVPLALAWGTLGVLLWLEDREGSRTL